MTAGTHAIELVRRAGIEHRADAYEAAERRGLQLELSPLDLTRLARANQAHIAWDH